MEHLELVDGYLVIESLDRNTQKKHFDEIVGSDVQVSGEIVSGSLKGHELKDFSESKLIPYRGYVYNKENRGTIRFIEHMPGARSNFQRGKQERETLHRAVKEKLEVIIKGRLEFWYKPRSNPKRKSYHIIVNQLCVDSQ